MYVFLKVEACEPWNLCVVSTQRLVGLNIWPQWRCKKKKILSFVINFTAIFI